MKQLSGYPQALGMSAGVMLVLAMLPGIPVIPPSRSLGAAALAWNAQAQGCHKAAEGRSGSGAGAAAAAAAAAETDRLRPKIDDLRSSPATRRCRRQRPRRHRRLTEQIKALRRSPSKWLCDAGGASSTMQLEANTYVIKIKEVDAGNGKIWPNQFMVMDPAGNQVGIPGINTIEPTFGLPATWVDAALKEEASLKGYTVVDAATVLSTHLTELLKNNMSDLLSYGEVQKLLKELPKEQGELIKDIVPSQVTISGIQRVLQLLLAERVSIRDLSTILEGIADALAFSRNPATMVEHVRARLARQICAQDTSHNGYLPLIALSARWEQAFAESIVGQGEERSLAMQPSKLSEFMTAVRNAFEEAAREGEAPVLVTSAQPSRALAG